MTIFKPGDLVVPRNDDHRKTMMRQLSTAYFTNPVTGLRTVFEEPMIVKGVDEVRYSAPLVFFTNGFSCFAHRVELAPISGKSLDDYL